jgi:hypothetical protein
MLVKKGMRNLEHVMGHLVMVSPLFSSAQSINATFKLSFSIYNQQSRQLQKPQPQRKCSLLMLRLEMFNSTG